MFNFFSNSMAPVNIEDKNSNVYPTWTWSTGIKDADGKDISVENLIQKYNTLLNENKILREELESIEEDGTEEHNNAIKLREENAQLKLDLDGWKKGVEVWKTQCDQEVARSTKLEDEILEYKKGNKNWMNLYQEVVDKNNELLKEIKHLSYLKEKNIQLTNRVNEIDSDENRELRAEILTLKNDIAILKSKYTELLEKYNGMVTQGGLKYMEAKLQIVQNNYKKCASERDEYKHQLNAANKENEKLKNDIIDYVYEKDKQKHPMYPIHWGGYDGAASAHPEEYSKWLNEQKDKAIAEKKQKEVEFDAEELLRRTTEFAESLAKEPVQNKSTTAENLESKFDKGEDVLDYFKIEKSWEQAASDLALRVAKLEKKVEELTLIKLCQKPS